MAEICANFISSTVLSVISRDFGKNIFDHQYLMLQNYSD